MSITTNSSSIDLDPILAEKINWLVQKLEIDFEIWRRLSLGDWDKQSDSVSSLQVSAELLEQVYNDRQVHSVKNESGECWILIPIKDTELCRVNYVALAQCEPEAVHVYHKLALSVLSEYDQHKQIVQLSEENEVFLQQVSEDFEELAFIRGMAERLALGNESEDLKILISHTLPLLGNAVGVQAFYFLTREDTQFRIEEEWFDNQIKDSAFDHAAVRQLVELFSAETQSGPVVRNDIQSHEFANDLKGINSIVLVELLSEYGSHGWFLAINRKGVSVDYSYQSICSLSQNELGTNEASLINTAAAMVSSHAHNLVLLDEREKLLVNMVRTLVSAIDSRDPYTCGHSERVALYAKKLAQAIGYREESCQRLYLTGLLHDIGKIGVSDAVLNKKGALTEEEFAEIKKHPDLGWSILRELEQLQYVLPGVLHHHERYDGRGYPDGLPGEETPIDGRLLAVVDAFDAMTSDRPYRQGMPIEQAIGILADGAGTQWDSEMVETFVQILPEILEIKDNYQRPPLPQRVKGALSNSVGSLS